MKFNNSNISLQLIAMECALNRNQNSFQIKAVQTSKLMKFKEWSPENTNTRLSLAIYLFLYRITSLYQLIWQYVGILRKGKIPMESYLIELMTNIKQIFQLKVFF
jgi:hypothetical protein